MKLSEWQSRSPLLTDLSDQHVAFLESVSTERHAARGTVLFTADSVANRFYLVLGGTVALTVGGPSRTPMTIQTVGEGSLLGLSWRFPPYRWQWTAVVNDDVALAEFDANAVLSACESDRDLDNALLRILARATSKRLQNVRLQLIDLYGKERS